MKLPLVPRVAPRQAGREVSFWSTFMRLLHTTWRIDFSSQAKFIVLWECAIDSGFNSFLLLFHEECITRFSGEMYQWQISQSQSTITVKSLTLNVLIVGGVTPISSMSLGRSGPLLLLTHLPFHLGTELAHWLASHEKVSDNGRTILTTFLSQMGMGN